MYASLFTYAPRQISEMARYQPELDLIKKSESKFAFSSFFLFGVSIDFNMF